MSEKISKLKTQELIQYEKISRIVCLRYENSLKNYNGTLDTNNALFPKWEKANKIRMELISEFEKRLFSL